MASHVHRPRGHMVKAPDESSTRLTGGGEDACVLHPRATVASFAEVCRNTALDFISGAGSGWGKAELAAWLQGPYRVLTRAYRIPERQSERLIQVFARVGTYKPVTPLTPAAPGERPSLPLERVQAVMGRARDSALLILERFEDPDESVGFAFDVLCAGHVKHCLDRNGDAGFVPVDLPRMRLADRVISLLAVDYLFRPGDYETTVRSRQSRRVG